MRHSKSPPIPHTAFDGYQLKQCLGRGGMGEVHLALDTILDRHVAIKFITAHGADAEARARFLVEARAIARLQHANVVSIYRVGEVDGYPYLVSEYVQGSPLDNLDPDDMDASQIVSIATGVARGLAAAHQRGVIHRDIKPANVMLTEDGDVKLLDFGIAKIMAAVSESRLIKIGDSEDLTANHIPHQRMSAATDEEEIKLLTNHTSTNTFDDGALFGNWDIVNADLTEPGTVMGTPRYMAPEIWLGEPATFRSDIFSFGALIYYLCSGLPPHTGADAMKIGQKIVNEDAVPLLQSAPSTHPGLAQIVDTCLKRDPLKRYENGNALRNALAQLTPEMRIQSGAPAGNPYRGLFSFEAEHRSLFFGRDSEIRLILERLKKEPVVVVVGDSGVGKSSLCRAGVIPRIDHWLDTKRVWKTVTLVPGTHPTVSLSMALASIIGLEGSVIETAILEEPGNVARMIRASLKENEGLFIFFDQLEELTTLSDPKEAEAVGELFQWLSITTPGLRMLGTVRSDFLGRLATSPKMTDQLSKSLFFLRPLTAERIREAVIGPAHAKGVSFESDELVDLLVHSTVHAQGGLPLLQFALQELWEVRDTQSQTISQRSLGAIGGVAGALSRHADDVYGQLLPKSKLKAKQILLQLTTANRTRARKSESELNPHGSEDIQNALDALTRGRLLVAQDSINGTEYEIAHETLLSTWGTLAGWLSDNAEIKAAKERLKNATSEWERLNHAKEALWGSRQLRDIKQVNESELTDKQRAFLKLSRRSNRFSKIVTLLLILLLPIVAGGIYALLYLQTREEQAQRIQSAVQEAVIQLDTAQKLKHQADKQKQQAITLFSKPDLKNAESAWDDYLKNAQQLQPAYARTSQLLEMAFLLDQQRLDVKQRFADLLFERCLLAEEQHQKNELVELLQRLPLYDDGSRMKLWNAQGRFKMTVDQEQASIEIKRYELNQTEKYELKDTGIQAIGAINVALPASSYLAKITPPGASSIYYPFLVSRNDSVVAQVSIPPMPSHSFEMAYIPPGSFLFGSAAENRQRRDFYHAAPIHKRHTDGYYIAKNETTFSQWLAFLEAHSGKIQKKHYPRVEKGGFQGALALRKLENDQWELTIQPSKQRYVAKSGEFISYPKRTIRKKQDWLKFPVVGITVDDAEAYVQWLDASRRLPGARLCTELEWERAARGADGREFPHGERLDPEDANYDNTYSKQPLAMGLDEVASHPASQSPFGINDMAGNAWEWTRSNLEKGYVARGGSYYYGPNTNRSTERAVTEKSFRDTSVGLRVCADIQSD